MISSPAAGLRIGPSSRTATAAGRRSTPPATSAARPFPCLRARSFAAGAGAPRRRPDREEAGLAERRDAATTTAATSTSARANETASSRATSSGSTTSSRSGRDVVRGLADVVRGLDQRYGVDGIRHRHRPARQRRVLPAVAPPDARRRRGPASGLHVFGEVFDADTLALSSVRRDRACRACSTSRSRTLAYASVSGGRSGIAVACSPTTTTSSSATASPTRRRRSSATTTWAAPAAPAPALGGRRDAPAARPPRAHLLYLLRGAPVVYYGDEVGMIGSGGDKLARQDMFPTACAEWRTERPRRLDADRHRLVVRRTRSSARRAARALAALRTRTPHSRRARAPFGSRRTALVVSRFDRRPGTSTSPHSTPGRAVRARPCRPRPRGPPGRRFSASRCRRSSTLPAVSR